MPPTHILLVEDDDTIASGLVYTFETEGYAVTRCESATAARAAIAGQSFAIAVLDLALPDGSGFALCSAIKQKDPAAPVIFLTAADDEGNTVRGLEAGADDYITKPFRVRELLARAKAVLRRAAADTAGIAAPIALAGGVEIHSAQGKVTRGGAEIIVTALEYRLLLMLAQNRGQVLSRGRLLEALWDPSGGFVNDNTLTVCVRRLREKLGDCQPDEPKIIETVRGLGYRASVG